MKEEIAKLYSQALFDELPPNVFADQVLRLFNVRGQLLDFLKWLQKQDLNKALITLVDEYEKSSNLPYRFADSELLGAFLDWLIDNPEIFKPNKPSIMLADEFLKSRQ